MEDRKKKCQNVEKKRRREGTHDELGSKTRERLTPLVWSSERASEMSKTVSHPSLNASNSKGEEGMMEGRRRGGKAPGASRRKRNGALATER